MLLTVRAPRYLSKARGYAANLAAAVMPTQLPTVQLEFVCVTRLGDPARTRTCTFFAPKDPRLSNLYRSRCATLGRGLAGRRATSTGCVFPTAYFLNEQKFVVIHAHVSELQLETARVQELQNADCPECKGEVPQHGGLRQKTCPRCNGRGWVRATR